MITGRGIFYVVLLAGMGLGVAYSGISQLYAIFLVILLLPLISVLQVLRLRHLITVSTRLDQPLVLRLDEGSMRVDVGLSGKFMSGLIRMSILKSGPTGKPESEKRWLAMMPATSQHLKVRLPTYHRGSYRIGLNRLVVRDLFGLFALPLLSGKACRLQQRNLTVLPRPLAFDPLTRLTESLSQLQHESAWQIGTDLDTIANIRSQQPGDSLKRAHWKLSARLDEMMIKEFENPRRMECLTLLDLATLPGPGFSEPDYGDYFADCAAHVCQVVLAVPCSLRAISWQPDGRQEVYVEKLADQAPVQLMLAGLKPTDQRSADRILNEESSQNLNARLIILITGRMNEAIAQQLIALRMLQRTVCLVLVLPVRTQMPQLDNQISRLQDGGVIIYRTLFTEPSQPAKPVADGRGDQT